MRNCSKKTAILIQRFSVHIVLIARRVVERYDYKSAVNVIPRSNRDEGRKEFAAKNQVTVRSELL